MQAETGAPLITPPPTDGPASAPATTAATTAAPFPGRRRRPLYAVLVLVGAVILAADQLTKAWALANLEQGEPRELIGSVLRLTLTRNPGAAFSVGTGATWVFTLIAVIVVVAILVASRRLGSAGWAVALGLLLGGCLGNLTDRLTQPPSFGQGHVIDFLQLPNWPIFNIADSAVVSAAVLIALLTLRGIPFDGVRAPQAHEGESAPAATAPAYGRDDNSSPAGTRDPAQTERDA